MIGVFVGLTSASVRMHRKRGSRSRFVKDAASWLRRFVESQRGQGEGEAPSRSVPGRVRFAPLFRMSTWNVQVQTRMRCRLPKESCADFPEASLQHLDFSHTLFFRDENIIVLEARSILCIVRYAESCCPPGRLLIFSDNLSLVLALCEVHTKHFTSLSVMRRICASGFKAGFVLSFRWILSKLNYSDKGSRFFDRDCETTRASHFFMLFHST